MAIDSDIRRRVEAAWDRRSAWDRNAALDAGRTVYEALNVAERPKWAARLLRLCLSELSNPPHEAVRVADVAADPQRWTDAYQAFQAVRQLTLRAERRPRRKPEALILYVAENVAKITYNSSGASAPFDHQAGWWLPMNVRDFFESTPADPETEAEVRAAIAAAP